MEIPRRFNNFKPGKKKLSKVEAGDKYYSYLRSPEWKLIREEMLSIARHKCQRCGSPYNLEIHHRTYKNLYVEHYEDLEVLCRICHGRHHGK